MKAETEDIVKRLLLSSPPGQIYKVIEDLETVCGEKIDGNLLQETLETYNCDKTASIAVPDSNLKILICEEARVDKTCFYEPKSEKVYSVDFLTQEAIHQDNCAFESELIAQRICIEDALKQYEKETYTSGYFLNRSYVSAVLVYSCRTTTGVYAKASDICIVINMERVNLRNFWSGRWASRWRMNLSSHPIKIHGSIDVHLHYFEDGNIQLQDKKTVIEDVLCDIHSETFGTYVVNIIKNAEDSLQQALEDLYVNMSQETLKEMRRIMPVTHMKMDWRIGAHRTAKGLTRTKPT